MKEYGLLQTLVLLLSFYFCGPIYGIVLIVILVWVVDFVLNIFGYQRVVLGDLFCSIEPPNANHSGCTIYIMERLKFEEFKEQMIKRALMKIRRFSQVMVTRLGIKLWKDVDPRSQIDNIIKSSVKCNNIKDLKNYANKLAEDFKLVESKPMWNYIFIEDYHNDKSAVMHVSHHSITDGIGFCSFMTTIDDEPFTHTINRRKTSFPLIYRIFVFLLSPYYLILALISNKRMRDKNSASKINQLKGKNDLKSKYYTSIEIPFEDIRKCYKKYSNTTFNDYFMGVLSVSMKKWFKLNGEDTRSVLARSPVATKGLPSNPNELDLTNRCVSIKYEYPLTDTIEEGIQNCRNSIKPNLNPISIMAKLKTSSLLSLFPLAFLKRFVPKAYDVDFCVSNFPLSNKNFKFNGKKIIDIRPFVNCLNYCNLYIFAFTYVDNFKIHIMANDKLKMNPQQLLEIITYDLQNEIANFKDF